MGKPTGFMENTRELPGYNDPLDRIKDYKEFTQDEKFGEKIHTQASRCMDCGVPFCHNGCPLGNIIPEFNDAVYKKDWAKSYEILASTNNFPEFTGRICPAPCETSCVLGINAPPVTISNIEKNIIEYAFKNNLVKPKLAKVKTGKKVAVVGGGPSGLATADQLSSAGHDVVVFERAAEPGGLVRFGIPDFKLEKWLVARRVEVMKQAGVEFRCGVNVGVDITGEELQAQFDAIVLTGGSTVPRDLPAPGRHFKGILPAMEFLSQNNSRVSGHTPVRNHRGEVVTEETLATGKNVIVIGGGDTGSDCVGTSTRHGAINVTQFELMPKPPEERIASMPWPTYPMILKTTTSHKEAEAAANLKRIWSINTKEFIGDENGNLKAIKVVDLEWYKDDTGRQNFREIPGSEREMPCELALLAMGFLGPQKEGILEQLGVKLDGRSNVDCVNYQTSVPKVFAAGDMRRGQSLVVWAISEGRECARAVDSFLIGGPSKLESKEDSLLQTH
jgi:glutamate synthase (NADPH/NADH) small chain